MGGPCVLTVPSAVVLHVSHIYRHDHLSTVTIYGGLSVGQALDEERDMLPTSLSGKFPYSSHFTGDQTEAQQS